MVKDAANNFLFDPMQDKFTDECFNVVMGDEEESYLLGFMEEEGYMNEDGDVDFDAMAEDPEEEGTEAEEATAEEATMESIALEDKVGDVDGGEMGMDEEGGDMCGDMCSSLCSCFCSCFADEE